MEESKTLPVTNSKLLKWIRMAFFHPQLYYCFPEKFLCIVPGFFSSGSFTPTSGPRQAPGSANVCFSSQLFLYIKSGFEMFYFKECLPSMPSCQEFTSASIYHSSEFTQWRRITVLLPQKTW